MPETVVRFDSRARGAGPDRPDVMERARALVPRLRDRAVRTEEERRMLPETERELHEAGLFRFLQPRRRGGSELDYVSLVDIGEILSRGDASVAWNVVNLASHHWMLGMFDPAAQDLVWDENPDALIASSFVFPAGRARRTRGGYVLSGRWPFSSAVEPSSWNMLAGVVSSEDEADAPDYRIFLVHRRNYRIIDTWDSAGLRGTGSQDVTVDETFVPESMSLSVRAVAGGPTPGSAVNPGPLYRLPVFALFPYVLSGVALGNAQGALDDHVAEVRRRASTYTRAKLGEIQAIQIKIAAAAAGIDAARLIMRRNCIDAMERTSRGSTPDMLERTRLRRDGAFAVNMCTEAVTALFGASGAGGLFLTNPLQRRFRDAHAINSHIAFSFDAAGSDFGRAALGFPPENATL